MQITRQQVINTFIKFYLLLGLSKLAIILFYFCIACDFQKHLRLIDVLTKKTSIT